MSCEYCRREANRRRDLVALKGLGPASDGYLYAYLERDEATGDEMLAVDVSEGDVSHLARTRARFCPKCGRDLGEEGK